MWLSVTVITSDVYEYLFIYKTWFKRIICVEICKSLILDVIYVVIC